MIQGAARSHIVHGGPHPSHPGVLPTETEHPLYLLSGKYLGLQYCWVCRSWSAGLWATSSSSQNTSYREPKRFRGTREPEPTIVSQHAHSMLWYLQELLTFINAELEVQGILLTQNLCCCCFSPLPGSQKNLKIKEYHLLIWKRYSF